MNRFNTPLRYPGGKGKLTNYIRAVIETNSLTDCHYVEAYAGGAGIGINLLQLEYATEIHLNDINPSIYAFWHSVLNRTEELITMLSETEVTMDEWFFQKSIQSAPDQYSLLELGFSTFFLNRTNRSGIIKGGVIGGKDQSGKWKLDARFNKPDLISRIKNLGKYADRIHIYRQDALEFLTNEVASLPEKTFVYIDPPYYIKGEGLYENHYKHEDHAKVAEAISDINDKRWIVSYDNVPQIRELYKEFRQKIFGLKYSAQIRYTGSEVMVYSPDLILPDVEILKVAA